MWKADHFQHSRCVQRHINTPADAARTFNDTRGNEICLVAIPDDSAICGFTLCLNVPSGYFVLHQEWYRNQGQLDPGVKMCWPFWMRVSHVVNPATITYSAPSQQVPTADNVMVDINLSLTFAIGPESDAAQQFVYHLGTTRFDEFLAAEVEEGIRGLVYSVTHERVNDLREEFALGMRSSLARKFAPFGIIIQIVKITEVRLPSKLAETLEQTTTFKTRIAEVAKKHENTIRVLTDEAAQLLEQEVRKNARRTQELVAQIERYEIEHKEIVDEVSGKARVAETEAQSKVDVRIAAAKGDLAVSQAEGQKSAEETRRAAQIGCDERKVQVNQKAAVLKLEANARLVTAQNDAKALVAAADVENKSTAQLEAKRRFELEWERLSVLGDLAQQGRRFISGKVGANVLHGMVPDHISFKDPFPKSASSSML
mmetsp:Transcript_32269/g.53324  ORF Transcript_32269/g.53324 Transcript_32269/m.53324 type:complete len:428 (-) Transcript_32269:450-1733(-)